MTNDLHRSCPDCDEPLAFAFGSTSGVGAHKRGDHFNTTPDTRHFVCLPCAKAWKQRLDGPLTPDVVGDLTFFTCGDTACGQPMQVSGESPTAVSTELTCRMGHRHVVEALDDGLTVRKLS